MSKRYLVILNGINSTIIQADSKGTHSTLREAKKELLDHFNSKIKQYTDRIVDIADYSLPDFENEQHSKSLTAHDVENNS